MGIQNLFKRKAKAGKVSNNGQADQTSSETVQRQVSLVIQKQQNNAENKDLSQENYGIKLLYPLDSAQATQTNIDVIFMHGLTGHREKTWTAPGASEPWPKLFLPEELPSARILTYGYDASVANWIAPVGQNTVREHAQNLVNDVHRYRMRTSSTKRPILWVVHSLGGLVLQDALILCNNPRGEGQSEILTFTKGIAFMGTPHAGSDFAKFAVAVANIINLSMVKKTNDSLLDVLSRHSEMLANIRDDFMTIVNAKAAKAEPIRLHSFMEELVVTTTGHRVVTPDSAKIVGYNADTIHANHMDMTRFSSKNSGYHKVAGTLMGWTKAIEKPSPIIYEFSSKELDCLRLLGPATYVEHKARNPDRVPGTCQWFLQHPNFRGWYRGISADTTQIFPGLLWVSGDPGCGKSVLSKSLCDHELKSSEDRTTCYFFFKDDDLGQKDAKKAICSLLHQLFNQRRALIRHAMAEFDANGKDLVQSFHILWNILLRATADPDAGDIICIIDALDECEGSGRIHLIAALEQLYGKSTTCRKPTVKFLVTSRPYVEIERDFQQLADKFPTIRLAGEEDLDTIGKEVNLVIEARVQILGSKLKLPDETRTALKNALIGVKNRTYLWVTLIFDVISESLKITEKSISTIISTLPTTVDKAYEAILNRGRDPPRARKLLEIIVAAERPLTLREMNIALNINKNCLSIRDIDLQPTEENLKTEIRNLCGLFISVVDSKIYLIHQTAKEFLMANPVDPTTLKLWKASFKYQECHFTVAESCMRYLVLLEPEFERMVSSRSTFRTSSELLAIQLADSFAWSLSGDFWANEPSEKVLLSRTYAEYAQKKGLATAADLKDAVGGDMLDYASRYWNVHLRNVTVQSQSLLLDMGLALFNMHSSRFFRKWLPTAWTEVNRSVRPPAALTDLIAAAFFGHEAVLKSIICRGDELNAHDEKRRTALHFAAWNGHFTIVELLVQSGARVNMLDQDRRTPLSLAIEFGHIATAKYLLLHMADPNIVDSCGFSSLSFAAGSGQLEAVELLMKFGANMEQLASDGRSLLSIAVAPSHPYGRFEINQPSTSQMIQTSIALIEKGASVNSRDNRGWTPLVYAALGGFDEIVSLLLKYGAIVDAEDNMGRTVLSLLPTETEDLPERRVERLRDIILILLQGGANISHKNQHGRTPLAIVASEYGIYVELRGIYIDTLVELGADVDSRDNNGQTPLMNAITEFNTIAVFSSMPMMQILLRNGANIDAQDARGWTAVMLAAETHLSDKVDVLIGAGANVNIGAKDGTTLLHIAVLECRNMVERIIRAGADLHSKTESGRTPLSLLTEASDSSTRALLLKYGAKE